MLRSVIVKLRVLSVDEHCKEMLLKEITFLLIWSGVDQWKILEWFLPCTNTEITFREEICFRQF